MSRIVIYTDGGCSNNQDRNNNVGGYGVVLKFNEIHKEINGGERNTTNNRMEILAVIRGLEMINESSLHIPVDLYADSAYVLNCMKDKWYVGWQKNGWKNSKKQPVENRDLWEQLIPLVHRHKEISWNKVKGHSGVEWNERADELADMAMTALSQEG